MVKTDTTQVDGFYYKQLQAPSDTTSFPKDTTIYINYTGRLLNGLVFDLLNTMLMAHIILKK